MYYPNKHEERKAPRRANVRGGWQLYEAQERETCCKGCEDMHKIAGCSWGVQGE